MTNSETNMDAIAGTSCNAGSNAELDSLLKNLSAWIASEKAVLWRLSLLITSCHTTGTQCCSGKENCKASVPCTTTRRRGEANE